MIDSIVIRNISKTLLLLSLFVSGCQTVSHTSNGKPIAHFESAGGLITYPSSWELPQYLEPPPNDITLSHYFNKWLQNRFHFGRYEVRPKGNAVPFKRRLVPSNFLESELSNKSILSYLYYDNGEVIHDSLAPASRFNFDLNNETEFRSNSVGKSFVSYLVGHAICQGYISSVDAPLNDWPVLGNTLYENQRLVDLLNMRARDQHVVSEEKGFIKSGRWFNTNTVELLAMVELDGTIPHADRVYNYHGFATNLAFNYMIFKLGDDWGAFLNAIFQDKIKIENDFFFAKNRPTSGWYSAYGTRYDYLRIAKSILNDWTNDTCVGKYLKTIVARGEPKNHRFNDPGRMTDVSKVYGGQFHLGFAGMKDRNILGLNGYGGQNVLIDLDNSRIVVTNSATTNFDWEELVYNAIKNGRLKD